MTDKRQLTVAIAAGGTAGHVNPALALADELRDRGHEVHFFGESRRLEGTLVPKEGFPFHPVHVTGFDRRRPWTLVTALVHLSHEEHRLIEKFGSGELPMPDVAIGFGAYLELPLMRAAAKLGIPIALHEQNSVPGLANKRTAKSARLIALGQPAAEDVMRSCAGRSSEVVFTGNPVRSSVLEGDRSRGRVALGIPQDATVLLVFGGSLGARHVNERLASLKRELLAIEGLHVVHSTGKNGYDETLQALDLTDAEASRWRVMPYIDDMGDTLAAAEELPLNTAVSGEISAKGDMDYYKITLPEDGTLQMGMTADWVSGFGESYRVAFYTADGTTVFQDDYVAENIQFPADGWKAGVYYFSVKPEYGTYPPKSAYTLTANFTPKSQWATDSSYELEPNGNFNTANPIALATPCKGVFSDSNDADCYTFSTEEAGKISVTLENPDQSTANCTVILYNEAQEPVGKAALRNSSTSVTIPEQGFNAGIFYVQVKTDNTLTNNWKYAVAPTV